MLVSDIHASDRAPSSCTDTYGEDILALLRESMVLARLRGAACVIWAGDVFHHKAPSRTSHRLVQSMIRIIQDAPCQVFIVPGNHDLQMDRLESLEVTQPLGVLYQAGAQRGQGWCSPFKAFAVPWLAGYGGSDDPERQAAQREVVREALRPYREAKIKVDEPYLVVTHAPLYPPGRELAWEHYPAEWWAEDMGLNGSVFYGHVHEPHGEYGFYGADPEHGDYCVTFCNNGALSRGSLHEYNLTRRPGVTWWDDQTGKFEFQALPGAKPAEEVFRLQEKQQVTDMQGRLDSFLSGVAATSLGAVSAESVLEHVRSQRLGKDVEDMVEELLSFGAAQGGKK
jgi:predicted phosphodiesterase